MVIPVPPEDQRGGPHQMNQPQYPPPPPQYPPPPPAYPPPGPHGPAGGGAPPGLSTTVKIVGGLVALGLAFSAGAATGGSGSASSLVTAAQPTVTVTTTVTASSSTTPTVATSSASSATASAGGVKGVTVTGDDADKLRVVSLKADRDAFGEFKPRMRIKNVSSDDLTFVSVKITALKGEEIIASADGIIESISAGQTVTFEPLSSDNFKQTPGLRYDIEIGG